MSRGPGPDSLTWKKYGSSPSEKPPARSYWLILIVFLNLPNLFPRQYARDGVVTLGVLFLVLISQLPTN